MYLNKNFAPSCNCGARILPGLKNPLLLKAAALVAIIVGSGLVFASHVTAQTFSNLYSFSAGTNNPTGGVGFTAAVSNYDGAYPACTLILVSNKLYGTCATGGSNQNGTLFAIGLDGTGFTNLYIFSAGTINYYQANNPTTGAAQASSSQHQSQTDAQVADGLFIGQKDERFFDLLHDLAEDADEARREH